MPFLSKLNFKPFHKSHLVHGFKTGLACLLSYGVTEYFSFDLGYWAVISSVIVMQVYVADSIRMCFYRFTGTAIGALLGIGAILIFPDNIIWTGVSVFVTTVFCSYMTFYNTRYKMAAITVVIVILASVGTPDRIGYGTARVIEIAIGVLSAFLVSITVFPARMIDVLKNRIYSEADEYSDKYDKLADCFISGKKDVDSSFTDSLKGRTWKNHELYNKVKGHESLLYRSKFDKNLKTIISTLGIVNEHLRSMTRALNFSNGQGLNMIMKDELIELKNASNSMLHAIVKKNETGNELTVLKQSEASVENRLKQLREKGVTFKYDLKTVVQVYSFFHTMLNLAEDLVKSGEEISSGTE